MLAVVLIEDMVVGDDDRGMDGSKNGFIPLGATRMRIDNPNGHGICETTVTHSIGCCNGTRTGNHNRKTDHGLGASARDKTMSGAEDNTINNTAAAVGISTPRNTVYIFLLCYTNYSINRLAVSIR